MYSQSDEEAVILRHFAGAASGRYLDVGAYDGRTFSNTLALVERGWGGCCVEPSPKPLAALAGLHRGRANTMVVAAALALRDGPVRLHDAGGDAVSTTDEHHRDVWQAAGVPYHPLWVWGISWETLGSIAGWEYQFLSLDTEGTNLALLRAMPAYLWSSLSLVCVEKDTPEARDATLTELSAHGFALVHETAENLLGAR